VRLLLDTHVLIWWAASDTRVGPDARARIDDRANEVLVSAATIMELEIKAQQGKLIAPDDAVEMISEWGFVPLSITVEHARRAAHLPDHHGDPFDRLLVAQAQIEDAVLVTVDRALDAYEVARLRAGG
jgi:PIN domain nuclease of toxin-antitoxin system